MTFNKFELRSKVTKNSYNFYIANSFANIVYNSAIIHRELKKSSHHFLAYISAKYC